MLRQEQADDLKGKVLGARNSLGGESHGNLMLNKTMNGGDESTSELYNIKNKANRSTRLKKLHQNSTSTFNLNS